MIIELTENEIKSLNRIIEGALIDLKGLRAVGLGGDMTIRDLNRIRRKIAQGGKQK